MSVNWQENGRVAISPLAHSLFWSSILLAPARLLSVLMAGRDSPVAIKCKYVIVWLPKLHLLQSAEAANFTSCYEFAMAMNAEKQSKIQNH